LTFPHYFHLLGRAIHPHPVMEVLAYTGGFQIYLRLRKRWQRGPVVPFEQNMWVLVGAIFGALVGSKLLAWLESPGVYFLHLNDPRAWAGGKTIVGGLLGGWAGVEIAKRVVRVPYSTGDLVVFPLIFGMAVGRVGCFLTGLTDDTYGNHTTVPWAVDFGDGPRHPTQLYDIVFLSVLAVALGGWSRRPRRNGQLFRLFMLAYLLYRFGVEFLKPLAPQHHSYAGLSAIQWACLMGAAIVGCLLARDHLAGSLASRVERFAAIEHLDTARKRAG
jgi:prolipoprotein diacylglyceryltransferase